MDTNFCSVCKTEKPFSDFYTKSKSDPRPRSKCKSCDNAQTAERRKEQGESYLERQRIACRKHYAAHPEQMRLRQRAIRKKPYTFQEQARSKYKEAVKARKLQRPTVCVKCGSTERIEAHHEDYTKPFEVMGLCRPCHSLAHRKS